MDESRCIEKEDLGPLASPLYALRKWEAPHSSHPPSAWCHPLDCLQLRPATSVLSHLTLTNVHVPWMPFTFTRPASWYADGLT